MDLDRERTGRQREIRPACLAGKKLQIAVKSEEELKLQLLFHPLRVPNVDKVSQI